MTNALTRRPGESQADHVERLLSEPLLVGLTSAEIAAWARCAPAVVRAAREEREGLRYAAEVAPQIGWSGTLPALIRAALTDYALRHCAAGLCTHDVCARPRGAQDARTARGATSARPAHQTRHSDANARRTSYPGAQPGHQSRGALGSRDPSGA
jgi:hypothetical protein